MSRRYALALSALIALVAVAGVVALTRTAGAGADPGVRVAVPDLAARERALVRAERRLERVIARARVSRAAAVTTPDRPQREDWEEEDDD